ncbi:MAG TPA: hypothetical protein VJH90_02855 [archaeon]|nr:hypothetical protein [archaeon]
MPIDNDKIVIKTEGGRTYVTGLKGIESTYYEKLLEKRFAPEEAVREIERLRETARKHRGS